MLLPQTAWLAFATLLVVVSGSLHQCRQPQRSGIFSLDTLANRDHITNLFHNITSQLKKFNATTTIQGQQYQIFNFTASLYYNDYAQVETIEGTRFQLRARQLPRPSSVRDSPRRLPLQLLLRQRFQGKSRRARRCRPIHVCQRS